MALKEIRWDIKQQCFTDEKGTKIKAEAIDTPKVWHENVERSFLESYAGGIGANAYCEGSSLEVDRAWDAPVAMPRAAFQFYRI